jgi:hypothetical protein
MAKKESSPRSDPKQEDVGGYRYRDLDRYNANYNYPVQNEPKERMGATDFANLPPKEALVPYGRGPTYRDGIIENFSDTVRRTSKISENQK